LVIIEAEIGNLLALHTTHHKVSVKRFFCGVGVDTEQQQ
jgi:hypothetical protein